MQGATLPAPPPRAASPLGKFLKNSLSNAGGMLITSAVALLIPRFLTRHLSVETYGAWLLILQLGAYVSYLDFGVQSALAKYIAEYEAKGDNVGAGRCASAGLAIMLGAATLGTLLTAGLALSVPRLFHEMPATLYPDVRLSILLVGTSLSIGLIGSTFSAVFLGLQRYQVTAVINIAGRTLYACVLIGAVALHSRLAVMASVVALVNLVTASLPFFAWRRLAHQIRVSLRLVDFAMLQQMLRYCFVLSIWSVCMLFISGLDMTIVGHYAFAQTAFYGTALAPTNFILVIIGSLLGPLLPATSAMSSTRTPESMGSVLLRSTRYSTLLLLLSGLPLMVGGYLVLRLWLGTTYAAHSVLLLRVLLIANIVRNLCAPYATMVVATARQRFITAAALTEAVVNLTASLLLVQRYGAIGVALGTLLGSFATLSMHFAVSMHFTQNLAVSRARLFVHGMLRPATMVLPSVLLFRMWWTATPPTLSAWTWLAWGVATLLIAWGIGLTAEDRALVLARIARRSSPAPA